MIALIAAFAIPAFAASSASADAPPVGNPGPTTLEITGGFLKVGATLEAPLGEDDLPTRPTFDATINANGDIFAAKSDFHFPHLIFPVENVPVLGNLDIGIDIIPTNDVTGHIDPDTGAMDLSIRIKIKATTSGLADVGNNCTIGTDASPITLNMSTTTGIDPSATPGLSLGGIPYDEDTGEARVADKTFSAPAHTGCTGLAAGQINGLLGLPSPAGSNSGEFSLLLTPPVVSPIIPRYTATPQEARVPFPVDFDASNSVSNIGPITAYKWDFDGDGTVDETNNGPTTTHVYDTAGVYHTKLTVVTDNGEVTKSRVTITAKSIIVSFNAKPPVSSTNRNPHFEFVANEPGASFECRFDQGGNPGTYAPCTSPVDFSNLADNDYVLQVRASVDDATGLPTPAPFRVDHVAPVVTVTGKPADRAAADVLDGNVAFEANEPSTFECRYRTTTSPIGPDAPHFGPCTSPTAVTWDAVEGTNKFDIRPTDLAGNVGQVVTATWEVDLTPPQAIVVSGPPSPTKLIGGVNTTECVGIEIFGFCIGDTVDTSNAGNNPNQSFALDSNEPGSTFVCSFNGSAERPCKSGIQTGLGIQTGQPSGDGERRLGNPVEGVNTFRVWATDTSGNRQGDPTVSTFIFDTTPPVVSALTGPADFTRNTTNTVTYKANEAVTSFECRFINNTGTGTTSFATGTGAPSGFVPCTPGQLSETGGWYTANGQTEGRKGVQIRATDLVGNVLNTNNNVLNNGGLTRYWTVDRTAPVASFASGSQQQGSFTNSTSAPINLASTDTPLNFGVTANGITGQTPTYQCSLNNGVFKSCSASEQVTGLNAGPQNMRVKVTDAATNVSSIVQRNWTVVSGSNATVTITSKPPVLSGSRNAAFEFNPDTTAQCRLDPTEAQNLANSGWAACATGKSYSGLADGLHTFQARVDGNSASVPASYAWTVYANLPTVNLDSQPGILRPDTTRYTGLDQDSADIAFSSASNPNGATTFRCRYYVNGDTPPAFTDCDSPVSVNWDSSADGQVRNFEIEPTSSTGNVGTVKTASWKISGTRPGIDLGNGTNTVTACNTGAAGGVGAPGCVATASSTEPGLRSNVSAPRFQAVSGSPVNGVIGYACQLNAGTVQNPCTARTSSFPAGGKPLTVLVSSSSRGNNDNFGTAPTLNGENTFKIWAVDNGGNLSDSPAVYTWVHDNVVPTFALTSAPPRTNLGTVTDPLVVNIEASEDMFPDNGFACRLIANGTTSTNGTNPGANPNSPASGWTRCDQSDLRHATWTADNLNEGNYALDVRGWDTTGNVATGTSSSTRPNVADNNSNGRRYIFTVDRTLPTSSITGGPAENATAGSKHPTFEFSASDPSGGSIDSYSCRIDPVDPQADDATWEACDSPFQTPDLADGDHVFQVRALDTAGNQEEIGATRNWTIDSTMPDLTVDNDLNGPVTKQTSATFDITVDPSDATLECRVIGPDSTDPENQPWFAVDGHDEDCDGTADDDSSDVNRLVLNDLSDAPYELQVRATGALGVTAVDTTNWTVDTSAPEISFDSGPSGPTNEASPSFAFSGDGPGSFSCKLDADSDGDSVPDAACTSPVSFSDLPDDGYTVTVVETDAAGNSSGPATRHFRVDTVAPTATITASPDANTEATTAQFEFNSDEAGSSFTCALDDGSPEACTSPKSFGSVAVGDHTFKVKATDAAGNVGNEVSKSWTIKEATPTTCPDGKTGTPPNCVTPPPDKCADGQTGTPPNCVTPPPDKCADGQTGTPPNCVTPAGPGKLAKLKVKARKKVKAGKKLKVTVKVRNVGESDLTKVKVCLKTPKKLVKGKAKRCKSIGRISPGGGAGKVKFSMKTKSGKKLRGKKLKVKAIVSGDGGKTKHRGHVTVLK